MAGINELFEARNEKEREEYAIESLVLSIQLALQKAMNGNCVSQKELADRLGVSPARVSQILSVRGANLTIKTIGKIAHALGEDFELVTKQQALQLQERKNQVQYAEIRRVARTPRRDPWKDYTANLNRFPEQCAAA